MSRAGLRAVILASAVSMLGWSVLVAIWLLRTS